MVSREGVQVCHPVHACFGRKVVAKLSSTAKASAYKSIEVTTTVLLQKDSREAIKWQMMQFW
eukprot:4118878-Amphidinium_carterae.2